MPEFLHPVCEALPSLHLNDALRMIAVIEAGLSEVWQDSLILLGWVAGCSVIAVKFFRWE
jgi:ABC-type multidrug transport system permease subunit